MPSHMFLSGPGQTNLVHADCAMTVFGRWHMVLFVFSVLYFSSQPPSLFHLSVFLFQSCTTFARVLHCYLSKHFFPVLSMIEVSAGPKYSSVLYSLAVTVCCHNFSRADLSIEKFDQEKNEYVIYLLYFI